MNTIGNFWELDSSSPDFPQILALDLKDFPRPWSEADWRALNWDHHLLYAFQVGGVFQTYALFGRVPGDDVAHLLKVCVAQDLRGSGLTQQFWKSCTDKLKLQNVKSIFLEVESPNQRAVRFYEKCGFLLLRKIKAYYSDGTDALTMEMTI